MSELSRRQDILREHEQRQADEELYETGNALRDHAEAEALHRDDLARDVAQMWGPAVSKVDAAIGTFRKDWPGLAAALDRLAAAYGDEIIEA